jgi:hypothetical protein
MKHLPFGEGTAFGLRIPERRPVSFGLPPDGFHFSTSRPDKGGRRSRGATVPERVRVGLPIHTAQGSPHGDAHEPRR